MSQHQLDTNLEIPVPEYMVFRSRTAGPTIRFFAVFFDFLIVLLGIVLFFVLLAVLTIGSAMAGVLKSFAGAAAFLTFLFFFLVNWLYFFLFEWLNRGRTPGKMVFKLRVISLDGTAPDIVQLLLRNLLRLADMFPYYNIGVLKLPTYLTATLTAFFSGSSFQRLGDLAASTIVVRENPERSNGIAVVDDPEIRRISEQFQMRQLPSPVLVQALNDFVANRRQLSPQRLHEIALVAEKRLRRYFGAGNVKCRAEELLFAAHYHLFHGLSDNGEEPEPLHKGGPS